MQLSSRGWNKILALVIVAGAVFVALAIFLYPKLVSKSPAQPSEEERADIVALVNGEEIGRDEFEARAAADEYFYTVISPLPEAEQATIRDRTLEEMIQEKLLTQFLSHQGLSVTDDEARQRIKEITVDTQFDGDWQLYEQELQEIYRTTLDEVIRTVRIDLLREKIAALRNAQHVFGIWVEKNQPQVIAYESMTPEQRAQLEGLNREKKEKAERAFARVQAGEDFAAIAREVSEHEVSAKNGGDLGEVVLPTDDASVLDVESFPFPVDVGFFDALRELGSGEAKLYEGFAGYFIIKIGEIQQAPLGTQSFEEWYAALRVQADVKTFL